MNLPPYLGDAYWRARVIESPCPHDGWGWRVGVPPGSNVCLDCDVVMTHWEWFDFREAQEALRREGHQTLF